MSELRSELWEKEMKLTDIRLEALNSAHQLDQLRETMHNMQVSRGWAQLQREARPQRRPAPPLPCLFWPQLEVDLLKAENDRLKVAPGPSSGSAPGQVPGASALSSPRRSLGLALTHSFSPSLTDTGTFGRRACLGAGRGGAESHPLLHKPRTLVASPRGQGGGEATPGRYHEARSCSGPSAVAAVRCGATVPSGML